MGKPQRLFFAVLISNFVLLSLFIFTSPPRVADARSAMSSPSTRIRNSNSGRPAALSNGPRTEPDVAQSTKELSGPASSLSGGLASPNNAPDLQSGSSDSSADIYTSTIFAEPQFNRIVVDTRIKNTGRTTWSPNAVQADVVATNQDTRAKRSVLAAYVVPQAPIQPGQEVSLRGFTDLTDFWQGTIQLSITLKVGAQTLQMNQFRIYPTIPQSATAGATPMMPRVATSTGSGALDLVIAIDSTGSMGGTIDAVKANAQDVVDRVRSTIPDSRFAFIAFRDFADGAPWPTIIRQDLTYDVNQFKTAVNQAVAGGGGDGPEAYIDVVFKATNNISWSATATRILMIMGDAPPHDAKYGTNSGDVDPYNRTWSQAGNLAAANSICTAMIAVGGGVGNATVTAAYQDMANITGCIFRSSPDSASLANDIVGLVNTIAPNPKGEMAPTRLPPGKYRENNPAWGGDIDEVFTWVHPQINNLAGFQSEYFSSSGRSFTATIPITRYFGTAPGGKLDDQVVANVIRDATFVVCAWDVDLKETINVQINGGAPWPLTKNVKNQDYGCASYPLTNEQIKMLYFPMKPGNPSDPTTTTGNPGTLTPGNNIITITYSPDFKALVYGMRLVIRAVRPVVLIPGFGAEANTYKWGEIETQLSSKGVEVKRPCHYEYVLQWTPIPTWSTKVFDSEKGVFGTVTSTPHIRCFESVTWLYPDVLGESGTLETNAKAIKWTINEIKMRYGVAKVNLVGHSKGGLFSREYISGPDGQGDVENLVTISSPHSGVYLLDVAAGNKDLPSCTTAWYLNWLCDLGKGNWEFLIRVVLDSVSFHAGGESGQEIREEEIRDETPSWNSIRQPVSGVKYHSVVATAAKTDDPSQLDAANHGTMKGRSDPIGSFSASYLFQWMADQSPNRGQSDIAILAPSQSMGRVAGYESSETSCQVVCLNHEESSQKPESAGAVLNALGLNPSFSPANYCGSVIQPVSVSPLALVAGKAPQQVLDPSQSLHFSGSITYGSSITVPFAVDGSDLKGNGLWTNEGALSLELVDPVGTIITSTITGTIDLGMAETYTVTNPIKGFWTAHITAPNSGPASGNILWDLWISQRSPISFTLSATPTTSLPSSSVILRGSVISNTTAITNADVQAQLRSSKGITQTVILFDDGLHDDLAAGDGIYGARFVPTQAGRYQVSGLVSGTLSSGVPYLRQAKTEFRVLPVTARFTGSYGDTGVDSNGDGLYENLRIQVGVAISQTGRYEIAGSLSTPDGISLGTVTTAISSTAGTTATANLDFEAARLTSRTADGPVVLRELTLIDMSLNLSTDHRQNVYTTTNTYRNLDFSSWEARIASPVSDQGVDTNSNGKFEYLDVTVPIQVRRPGVYTATLALELGSGNALVSPQAVVAVASVSNPISLTFRFNGPMIAAGAANGPYDLESLLLEGPLGIVLSLPRIGHTAAYAYSDFEADRIAPTTSFGPVPSVITSTPVINLNWAAIDPQPSAGIFYYDLQYKTATDGIWTDWLTGTVLTSARFGPTAPITLTSGETYYFRVRATDYAGNQETYRPGDGDAHTTILGVDLQVTKSTSSQFIQEGSAAYTITYGNQGPFKAFNAILTDTLPGGLTYVSDTSGITPTISGNQIVWPIGNVFGYQSSSFNVSVLVSPTLPGGTTITNSLAVSSSSREHNYANNTASLATTVVTATADVNMSKSLNSGTTFAGNDVKYQIYFANTGNSRATDVVITDTLPISTSYVSYTGNLYNPSNTPITVTEVITNGQVAWKLGTLQANGFGYLYPTIHISDTAPDNQPLTNTVRIATSRLETNFANNVYTDTRTVTAHTRDLSASTVLSNGAVVGGNDITYRIYVANQGNTDAANITVTNTLPVSTTYVADTNSYGFTTAITGNTVVWTKPTMVSGGYAYLYLTARISDTVQAGNLLTNTTTVSTSDVDANPANNVYTYTLTAQAPTKDMYVSNSLSGGSVTPGNNLTYQISFSNQGNSAADNVVITDTLPVSTTFVSFSGSFMPTVTSNQVVWNLGKIPGSGYSGYYGSLSVTASLSDQVAVGTVITNTARISTSSGESNYSNNVYTDTRTVVAGISNLYLSKSLQGYYAAQGAEIGYRLYYQNSYADAATNVVLTDTLPAGVSYLASSGAPAPTQSGSTLTWNLGAVPGGINNTIYLTVSIPSSLAVGTVLTNTAGITATNDTYPANNVATDVHAVVAATRDLSVGKALSSGNGAIGSDLTYQISYANYGTASVRDVIITDTLPAEVSFVSATGPFTPTRSGNLLIWNLGTVPSQLATGYSGTLYVTVHILDTVTPGVGVCNRVDISTTDVETGGSPNTAVNCQVAQAPTRDVSVSKSLYAGTPAAGNTQSYRLFYYNSGNSPAANVTITDTLPAGMTYDSAYSNYDYAGWTRVVSGNQVIWTRPTLLPSENGYLYASGRISTTVAAGTWLTNTAQIATTSPETDYTDNLSAVGSRVLSSGIDLGVSKSWVGGSRVAGQSLTYRITYQNSGAQSATNAIITDTLPAEMSYSGWNYSGNYWWMVRTGNVITWTRSSVAGGESGYLDLTVAITNTVPNGTVVTNTVDIASSNPDDNPADNRVRFPLTIATANRDLYIDKIWSGGNVVPGQDITYRLYYVNYGTSAAANVLVTDTLPTGAAFVSASGGPAPAVNGNRVVWNLGTVPGQYNPGYYGYLYVTVHLADTVAIGSSLCNRADIGTSDPETGLNLNTWTTCLTVQPPTRDVHVSKSLAYGSATAGNNLTYQIYFGNGGNSPASSVLLTETLPVSTTFLAWSGYAYTPIYRDLTQTITPTVVGNQVVWNLGTLPSGSYGYLYPQINLSPNASVGASLVNTARISALQPETDYSNNQATDTRTVVAGISNLYLTKSLQGYYAAQGSEIGYRLYYQNSYTDAATNVVLTDTLPAGVSYLASSGAPAPTQSGNTLTWNLGAVPGGINNTIYLTVSIPSSLAVGTVLTNTAGITATNDTYPANNVATDVHAVVAASRDLSIGKWMSGGTPKAGSLITYTISYANAGNASASTSMITDTLPTSVTYVSSTGPFPPAINGNRLIWSLGTIPAPYTSGYQGTWNVVVRISPAVSAGTVLTNVVDISTRDPETNYLNNHATNTLTIAASDYRLFLPMIIKGDPNAGNSRAGTPQSTATLPATGTAAPRIFTATPVVMETPTSPSTGTSTRAPTATLKATATPPTPAVTFTPVPQPTPLATAKPTPPLEATATITPTVKATWTATATVTLMPSPTPTLTIPLARTVTPSQTVTTTVIFTNTQTSTTLAVDLP